MKSATKVQNMLTKQKYRTNLQLMQRVKE